MGCCSSDDSGSSGSGALKKKSPVATLKAKPRAVKGVKSAEDVKKAVHDIVDLAQKRVGVLRALPEKLQLPAPPEEPGQLEEFLDQVKDLRKVLSEEIGTPKEVLDAVKNRKPDESVLQTLVAACLKMCAGPELDGAIDKLLKSFAEKELTKAQAESAYREVLGGYIAMFFEEILEFLSGLLNKGMETLMPLVEKVIEQVREPAQEQLEELLKDLPEDPPQLKEKITAEILLGWIFDSYKEDVQKIGDITRDRLFDAVEGPIGAIEDALMDTFGPWWTAAGGKDKMGHADIKKAMLNWDAATIEKLAKAVDVTKVETAAGAAADSFKTLPKDLVKCVTIPDVKKIGKEVLAKKVPELVKEIAVEKSKEALGL